MKYNSMSNLVVALLLFCCQQATASSLPSFSDSIDAFWIKTRQKLDAVPMEAKVSQAVEGLPFRKYIITLQSLNNVTIVGYLAIPVQGEGPAKPWPLLVTTTGYSGNGLGLQLGECQRGYAVLHVYPRGQGPSADYFNINSDKLSTKLTSPEGYYYQGGYMDIIRMIDYAVTRPDIDSTRIAMVGTSQGGGMALAITALDSRVKAVVAHVPFMCNIRLTATLPSHAKTLLERAGNKNEAAFATIDYFDPYMLARRIKVPAFVDAGGKDVICPAPAIKSVYDRIKSEIKEYHFYPDLTHTSCMDSYARTWVFLDQYFKNNKAKM